MAKVSFERSKPHVDVLIIQNLQKLGISFIGAHQISTAQTVTNPEDRVRLAAIIGSGLQDPASGIPTGKRRHSPFSVSRDVD